MSPGVGCPQSLSLVAQLDLQEFPAALVKFTTLRALYLDDNSVQSLPGEQQGLAPRHSWNVWLYSMFHCLKTLLWHALLAPRRWALSAPAAGPGVRLAGAVPQPWRAGERTQAPKTVPDGPREGPRCSASWPGGCRSSGAVRAWVPRPAHGPAAHGRWPALCALRGNIQRRRRPLPGGLGFGVEGCFSWPPALELAAAAAVFGRVRPAPEGAALVTGPLRWMHAGAQPRCKGRHIPRNQQRVAGVPRTGGLGGLTGESGRACGALVHTILFI